jgi:hypothetical protein
LIYGLASGLVPAKNRPPVNLVISLRLGRFCHYTDFVIQCAFFVYMVILKHRRPILAACRLGGIRDFQRAKHLFQT